MKQFLILLISAFALSAQVFPDPDRTPGVRNPDVTQDNIHQTICMAGWTKTIRPKTSYTNKLKAAQMAELDLSGKPNTYEEDHFLPLEIGGHPTDPHNLWPEPWPWARLKDVVETYLHRQVCADKMTLKEAQTELLTDWTAVYERIKGVPPAPKK